ncbi:MAG: family 20 glycosylhydrolase, partial [Candidatus Omnitrophica bacterium]|nr:family 20 glycosylhydrolase [Candidatus Omnitrophota bacterium]
ASPPTIFHADPKAIPRAQGYSLSVAADGIRISAHDEAGLFYGLMTLRQIARHSPQGKLPFVQIEDWPEFPNRGVLLDVSRDKVPEMETLYALVDRLSEWKCNQLQLYTEHTFAYRDHPIVWRDASPMTPAQTRALDDYCRERFVEFVPNQNSFGHMDRWLKHEQYKRLAEMPEGGSDLCGVDPECENFIAGLYADLLPNFSSRHFNVCCDETWSLGKGRSKEAADQKGVGRVYLDFLLKIHDLVASHGRTMMFWGDIIMQHPELIPELPKDVIAMEWGYEAEHPFAEHGKKFAESGIPFYVCPGTSAWNSLVGRTDNAIQNLRNAAQNGLANGAVGYLVTDWGDGGHWQPLPVSYLGYACGAAFSWSYEANQKLDIRRALDVHAFQDSAGIMGRLAYDLGNAYQKTGVTIPNSTLYYMLLQHRTEGPIAGTALEHSSTESLTVTIRLIDDIMGSLPNAKMSGPDAETVEREFRIAADLARFACRLGISRIEAGGVGTSELPAEEKKALAAELEPLIPAFRQVWLERNRSGGLKDSAGRLENLLAALKKS